MASESGGIASANAGLRNSTAKRSLIELNKLERRAMFMVSGDARAVREEFEMDCYSGSSKRFWIRASMADIASSSSGPSTSIETSVP